MMDRLEAMSILVASAEAGRFSPPGRGVGLALRVGALADSTLVAVKVGEIRRVICGSPAYFAAHGTPKAPEDLVQHMCVTFTGLAAGGTWTFNHREGATKGVRPLCRLKVNT